MTRISGTSGNDTLTGTGASDTITGAAGNDLIDGAAGTDLIDGGDGSDVISGGAGDDGIRGGQGLDLFKFQAGDGKDTIADLTAGETVEIHGYAAVQSIAQVGTGVVLVLSSGDQITFQNASVATVQAALHFVDVGGGTIQGTSGTDTLSGNGGDDTINGLGGEDNLSGGAGADTVNGGDDDDLLFSDQMSPPWSFPYYGNPYTAPELDRGTAVDTVNGGNGDDSVFVGYGDSADGGANIYGDRLFISFQGATSGVSFDFRLDTQVIGGGTITGFESVSWVEGSNYDDYINVQSTTYTPYGDRTAVFGMDGDDTLVAGSDTMLLDGGAGDDILYGGSISNGGDGNDTIYDAVSADGGSGNDTIFFYEYNYSGSAVGGAGNDEIHGNSGANSIGGDEGEDTLYGADGNDLIDGGAGNDILDGDAGDDTLDGGTGHDTLEGGDGRDVINGGAGNDTLAGGDGNDQFVYHAGDGTDVITDFADGDSLVIDGYASAQSITQVGSDVVVALFGDDQITFSNTDVATVQAGIEFGGLDRPNDVAISADGTKIYAAGDDGNLRVYDPSGALLAIWHVGTELGGIDISPDGSFAMVVDLQPVALDGQPTNTVSVYKVDLATGAVTTFNYATTWGDYVFHDVAVLADGTVLLSESFSGSGGPSSKLLDLSTGAFTSLEWGGQDTVFTVSPDGSYVFAAPENISDARLLIYQNGVGITANHGMYQDGVMGFNWGVQAFSATAGLAVQGMGTVLNIYDDQLHYEFDLSQLHPELAAGGISGVAFDASGQFLFVLNGQDNSIYQVSTSDWSVVGEFAIGGKVGSTTGDFGNRLLVAPDMSYFTVVTEDGFVIVDPAAPPPPTDEANTLLGTPGNDTIDGLGGNDLIKGFGGNDTLSGGSGDDTVAGGSGVDAVSGGDGNDTLFSADSAAFDAFFGNGGAPLDHGTEVDTLVGGAGDDLLIAGYGDNVDGGDGDDSLYVSFQAAASGVSLDLGHSSQTIGGGTITGVENYALVEGSNFDDYINADADQPIANFGFGVLRGMAGDDTIIGGDYTGYIDGGDGDDTLYGLKINYLQSILGGAGNDTIYLGYAREAYGGSGNDILHSEGGTLFGDEGNDQLTFDAGTWGTKGYGGVGDDTLTGSDGAEMLFGGAGADVIQGNGGDDVLYSAEDEYTDPEGDVGTDHDVVTGGLGNDSVSVGYGDDADGGDGTDSLWLNLTAGSAGVTLNTSSLFSGSPILVGGGTIENFEALSYLRATDFADTLTIAAQSIAIAIDAGGGNDTVNSSADNVTLSGGSGDDAITATGDNVNIDGGAGADTIVASGTWVSVYAGDGNDTITVGSTSLVANGGSGDDILIGGPGGDRLIGADGVDTVDYRNATAAVTVDLGTGIGANGDELFEFENVTGSSFADKLTGDSFNNALRGAAGNDTLDGAAGNDTLEGGTGNDTAKGGAGVDTFVFRTGDGSDVISDLAAGESINIYGYTSAQSVTQSGNNVIVTFATGNQITISNSTVSTVNSALHFMDAGGGGGGGTNGTAGNDTLNGTSGNDTLNGLGGNDVLNGNAGNDILDGGTGNDTMKGGTGNDTYYVDSASDVVTELSAQGTDLVHASVSYTLGANVEKGALDGSAAISLTGNGLANTLTGNSGDNFLYGVGGSDTLSGGAGNDTLRGGLGADILTGGAGADKFQFEKGGGNDRITDFVSGTDKIDLHLLGITSANVKTALSGGNTIVSVDADHNGTFDFTITLTGVTHVGSSDYIF
jgi:Ca2+-binding RTX toxin-like protein